jgi:hypothetical protein
MNFGKSSVGTSGVAALALAAALCAIVPLHAMADAPAPFVISVDGVSIDGSARVVDPKRQTDVALEAVDVQVKFDGLGVAPMLNVSTFPARTAYKAGETLIFLASSNYPAWIARSEIRIFKHGDLAAGKIHAMLAVSDLGGASWQLPEDAPADMDYVLRVYDGKGRFDETRPLPLIRSDRTLERHTPVDSGVAPGYGEDRTAARNIPVYGGAVTVHGKNIPAQHDVRVLGDAVPVDAANGFVVQRILPPGTHNVDVSIRRDGKGLQFDREIDIPENEWFYVALADLTAGYRFGAKNIEDVKPGEYDTLYTRGRLAFYLKGKIQGRYLLTAAADTGEDKIQNIFKGIDAKDPRQYLKRIDPDDYYPVYGDDSTAEEDAPTRGKFYIRLARGASHVMWGNFRSNITGTQFLRSARAVYGASGVYRSETTTGQGEAKTGLDLYAAQPGTLPQHDLFRGTGGSAYFLKHRDITIGSERLSIVVRNAVTGWDVERRTLKSGDDYEIDYVQGILLLKKPLPSSSVPGTENFLVADYEFTPASGEADGYVLGGRAQQWLGGHVRLGATGLREKTGSADQELYGADIHVEATPGTYVEAEAAHSKGPGFGTSYSPDGGITVQTTDTAGTSQSAEAYRVEGQAKLADVTGGKVNGTLGARYERYGKGYSSLDYNATESKESWGADGDVALSDRVKASGGYIEQQAAGGKADREANGKLGIGLDDHWSVEVNGHYEKKDRPAPSTDDAGERGDAGLRVIHSWNEHTLLYVLGQTTVARAGSLRADDRAGVGGKRQLTEKIGVSGEISYGTLGFDAMAAIDYTPAADDRYYAAYRLDAERDSSASWPYDLTGSDLGTIVAGMRHRYSDRVSVFAEDNYDMFGRRQSITQVYGVNYTPDARWTFGGGAEVGTVYDDTVNPDTDVKNSDFDRRAISLSAAYRGDGGIDGKAKGEIRFDNSDDDSRDLESYLFATGLGIKVSEDWRALASLDAVVSNATDTTRDGEFAEGSIGFAYRPSGGGRFNALVKYSYLHDSPGADQVTVDGTTDGPAQRSHIFSGDASYDLTNRLTIGGKYGFRIGETRDRAVGSSWEESAAHLGILRADLHIVREWDGVLEGRALWTPYADTIDFGLVAAVYRHLGGNMKLGLGYNFGAFSDDLRDLVHDDQGVFVNLIGKF